LQGAEAYCVAIRTACSLEPWQPNVEAFAYVVAQYATPVPTDGVYLMYYSECGTCCLFSRCVSECGAWEAEWCERPCAALIILAMNPTVESGPSSLSKVVQT